MLRGANWFRTLAVRFVHGNFGSRQIMEPSGGWDDSAELQSMIVLAAELETTAVALALRAGCWEDMVVPATQSAVLAAIQQK